MGGAHEGHGLSDAEKAKIHGKINGAKALEASEKMRAYLENKARKQREAMERRYGVGSLSGGLNSRTGRRRRSREASSVTLGVGAEVKRAAAIAVEAGIRACTPESSAMLAQGLDEGRFDAFGGSRDLERPRGSVGGGGFRGRTRSRRLRRRGFDPARVPAEGGGLRHRQARAPALVQPKLDQGRENQRLGAGR